MRLVPLHDLRRREPDDADLQPVGHAGVVHDVAIEDDVGPHERVVAPRRAGELALATFAQTTGYFEPASDFARKSRP